MRRALQGAAFAPVGLMTVRWLRERQRRSNRACQNLHHVARQGERHEMLELGFEPTVDGHAVAVQDSAHL